MTTTETGTPVLRDNGRPIVVNGEPLTYEALERMLADRPAEEPYEPTDADIEALKHRNPGGRPPLGDTPTVSMMTRVTQSFKQEIDAAAKARGVTTADFVRTAVASELSRTNNPAGRSGEVAAPTR